MYNYIDLSKRDIGHIIFLLKKIVSTVKTGQREIHIYMHIYKLCTELRPYQSRLLREDISSSRWRWSFLCLDFSPVLQERRQCQIRNVVLFTNFRLREPFGVNLF